MLNTFKNHIDANFNELLNTSFLIAVSGGVDSMVLVHLCYQLSLNFGVAHCNFQLRGNDSDLDEELVKKYCEEYRIPFHVIKFDTEKIALNNKTSIQITARELRYNWFKELCNNFDYRYIATAHHLDDQVETFLINFTRGTGIDGLVGIPTQNNNILRPLLIFSRDEILNYAVNNKVTWREDISNATTKYYRNKLRHLVIPIFKAENSQFLKSFQNTIHHLQTIKKLANNTIDQFKERYVKVIEDRTLISLNDVNETLFNDSLFFYLKEYGFDNAYEIQKLLKSQSGKLLKNDKFILLKNRNYFIIYNNFSLVNEEFSINNVKDLLGLPLKFAVEECFINDFNSDKNTIFVEVNKLKFPLKLRKAKNGDIFQPFGMKGFKKVSKFLKDEKFSLLDKNKLWILENGDDKIIWLVGHRMDDRFKITKNNQKLYKLTVEK